MRNRSLAGRLQKSFKEFPDRCNGFVYYRIGMREGSRSTHFGHVEKTEVVSFERGSEREFASVPRFCFRRDLVS